jgi:tetratricopeptide (TPR) repeat protein
MDLAELRLRAAQALTFGSNAPRAVALAEAALDALDETATPERRALLLERLGRIAWIQQHGKQAAASYEQAVALLTGRPPSAERAFALSALGQSLMLRGQDRRAERVLREAIEVARQVDATAVEGHALCSLGPALVALGQIDNGLAALDRADALNRKCGATDEICRAYVNRAHSYYCAARYTEAAEIATEGARFAIDNGRVRLHGQAIVGNGILALTASGRWHDAQRAWTSITEQIPDPTPYLELRWIGLLLDQGRLDEARSTIAHILDATVESDDTQHRAAALLRRAGHCGAALG